MDSPGFQGFSATGLAFLRELRTLQERFDFDAAREYYAKNKSAYEREVKEPLGALVEEVGAVIQAEGMPLKGDRKQAIFRINRDIRFSPDKSPYKTHAGAVLSPTGHRNEQGVLYIHIDPSGSLMAAGFYMPTPDQLARLRQHIHDKPRKFKMMLAKLKAHGLDLNAEDTLKRLPRGFEDITDPVLARAVKLKHFTVARELADGDIMNAGLVERLVAFAREVLPLLEFGLEALRGA